VTSLTPPLARHTSPARGRGDEGEGDSSPTLAVVIVSWNVRDLLQHCLEAVVASLAGSGISYRIVVVDNASADGTPAMLRERFPHVELIAAGANIGFAAGNNLALRAIMHETDGDPIGKGASRRAPPYILLLNPDTAPVGDAIPQLVRWLEAHPEAVAVGPQLRYADGSLQSSRRRFPTRLTLLWESTPLERLWPGNPWAQAYRMAGTPDDTAQPVGWLVGAAILARTSAIRAAGLLDERFFMYSEELEWQWRMQQSIGREASRRSPTAQSAIWYLPTAVITHYEGKSSEQAVAARYLNFNRSKLLLARMWYGWGYARMLRFLLRLSFAYELAVETAKLLAGHRRDLRRRRVRVYLHVLRSL
jgi:GT2 family glycosyltransferase